MDNMAMYDDMMGLEFGDYEGFMNMEEIKQALVASTVGGGAILLTSYVMKIATQKLDLAGKVADPLARSAITSGAAFLLAVFAGRAMWNYNDKAAMGIMGGLGGFAMANLLDSAMAKFANTERLLGSGLGEDDSDESLLSDYDGMSALAALETTGVTSAAGAFSSFEGPSVTNEPLFGLNGTVVQEETLGSYQPYLA